MPRSRSRYTLACLLLVSFRFPAGSEASQETQAPTIDHRALECIEAKNNPLVEASITASRSVEKTRVFFKSHEYPDWYFVEMKTTEVPAYLGVLPQPLPETRQVDYYLEALDSMFLSARTVEHGPTVSETECERRAAPASYDPDSAN
jgi:hypothetical protein